MPSRKLFVSVHNASALTNRPSRLPGARSDPRIVICLDGDYSHALASTREVKNDLNPVFNETFSVDVGRAAAAAMDVPGMPRMPRMPRLLSFVVMDGRKVMGRAGLAFDKIVEEGAVDESLEVDTGGSVWVTVASRGAAKRAKRGGEAAVGKKAVSGFGKIGLAAGGAGVAALVAGMAGMAMHEKKEKEKGSEVVVPRTGGSIGGRRSGADAYGYEHGYEDYGREGRDREDYEGWFGADSESSSNSSSSESGSSSGSSSGSNSGSSSGSSSGSNSGSNSGSSHSRSGDSGSGRSRSGSESGSGGDGSGSERGEDEEEGEEGEDGDEEEEGEEGEDGDEEEEGEEGEEEGGEGSD